MAKDTPAPLDFREFAAGAPAKFTVVFRSPSATSLLTKKRCVYFEVVQFQGEDDIRSSHKNLWHTEADLEMETSNAKSVIVSWRALRPHVKPAFQKRYEKGDALPPGIEKPDRFPAIIEEYCLVPGQTYFAEIHEESYHLPPGPEGRPIRRTNRVLWVSDSPLPNEIPLTPVFQGWSY